MTDALGERTTVRAVVTDIDGTLTDRERRLDLPAVQALRTLSDRGVPVLLATGNVLPIALALARVVGIDGPIVAENGGLIYHPDGRILRLSRRSVAWKAYRHARRTLPLVPLFTDRWRETEVAVEPSVNVTALRRAVRGMGVRVESTGFAVHLFEPSAGKLPAVRRALSPLHLSLRDCLVAGDGDNDVGMLRRAGVGVSFPDASPRARAAARYVAPTTGGAGLVKALKHYGLLPGP
jgi:phosphoglycolate phosphatase (TIGR01487 family)